MCLVRHPSRSLHESVPRNQVPKPKSSLAPPPSRLFLEQGFVGKLFSNFPHRIGGLTCFPPRFFFSLQPTGSGQKALKATLHLFSNYSLRKALCRCLAIDAERVYTINRVLGPLRSPSSDRRSFLGSQVSSRQIPKGSLWDSAHRKPA